MFVLDMSRAIVDNGTMLLNGDCPEHFYALIRAQFLYDQTKGHGDFVPCVVFGVASIKDRALGFHVMLETGGQFARLPLTAIVWKKEAPDLPLGTLQAWDCFGYEFSAHKFAYLAELSCKTFSNGVWYPGHYVFTIDWIENGFSDEPTQHKNAHILRLENGCFAAQPNNRVLWQDKSFTKDGEPPAYIRNSFRWHAEQ
jgi:hypothetical protein